MPAVASAVASATALAVPLAVALAEAVEVVAAGSCETPHNKPAVQESKVAAPTNSTRKAAALIVANRAAEVSIADRIQAAGCLVFDRGTRSGVPGTTGDIGIVLPWL